MEGLKQMAKVIITKEVAKEVLMETILVMIRVNNQGGTQSRSNKRADIDNEPSNPIQPPGNLGPLSQKFCIGRDNQTSTPRDRSIATVSYFTS